MFKTTSQGIKTTSARAGLTRGTKWDKFKNGYFPNNSINP